MSIFEIKNKFYELATKLLWPDLMSRDQEARFSQHAWREFAKEGLFRPVFESDLDFDLKTLSNYYNICRASCDMPFTSSLAAHGFVSALMLKKFASKELFLRYQDAISGGEKIGAICNSEVGTSTNLKRMSAMVVKEGESIQLRFHKPCITNGYEASLLFTTLWNEKKIELYILEREEVLQNSISGKLIGFRTGDTGSVQGAWAKEDFWSRRLTAGAETLQALRYCFFIERLIVTTMAVGTAHGVEDFLLNTLYKELSQVGGDLQQYRQEKILQLHQTRIQMTSLLETLLHRGAENLFESESELAILKLMISRDLRSAVFSAIEAIGHKALFSDHVLPKVLRDLEMCSFFGGTSELQKINLYASLIEKKAGRGAA